MQNVPTTKLLSGTKMQNIVTTEMQKRIVMSAIGWCGIMYLQKEND